MPNQMSLQMCFNEYVSIKNPFKLAYLMLVYKQMVVKCKQGFEHALTFHLKLNVELSGLMWSFP